MIAQIPFSTTCRLRLKQLLVLTVVLGFTAIALGACGPGSHPPSCDLDAMSAPLIISPGGPDISTVFILGENPPEFAWEYHGSCMPDDFRIIVSRNPVMGYGDYAYMHTTVMDLRTPGTAGLSFVGEDGTLIHMFTWRPGDPLARGVYYWRIVPYSGDFHGENSEWAAFQVGAPCSRAEDYTVPPRLVYPYYGGTVYTNKVHFMWVDENTCPVPGKFQVEVSRYTYFPESDTRASAHSSWTDWPDVELDYCTRYYWRVRTWIADTMPGPVSDIFYFDVSSMPGGTCPVPSGAPAASATAASAASAAVIEDAACWSGPSIEYSILDYLALGQQLEIQGRDQWNTWWYVDDPALPKACWVFGEHVQASGDLSQVPVVQPPPLPTHTPTTPPVNCGQYTNPTSCGNNQACWWNPNDPPNSNGSCKHK